MAKRRRKSSKSCPAGHRAVRFKAQGSKVVCFKNGKKKRGGKRLSAAKKAKLKSGLRKACKRPGVRAKMPGLCKWAGKAA